MEIPFELEALRQGVEYQKWVIDSVSPYLGQRILEIGAGIGNMSVHLPLKETLVLSEADPALLPELDKRVREKFSSTSAKALPFALGKPMIEQLGAFHFDTIVSFNVLEHVEKDKEALEEMRHLLEASNAPGPKKIISFVPAHQWLYGSIDREYQHFRRYSRKSFWQLAEAAGFSVHTPGVWTSRYFNAVGMAGWFFLNRIRRQKEIGLKSVLSFEKICPLIRDADDFVHEKLHLPFGQSLLVVLELPKQ